MRTPDLNPTLVDLIGEASISDIIDHRLMPAPYEGGLTQKYFVDGLPEVIIRHTPGEPEPEIRESVATAFNQLPNYGIASLPYIPVERHGKLYVVTRKVHGESLIKLASPDADPNLVESIDVQWANIIVYFRSGREEGFTCASDIVGLHQHMYGKTSIDPQDKVLLVDLGQSTVNYAQTARYGEYERALLGASNDLVETERTLAKLLSASRTAINSAIHSAEENYGDEKTDGRTFINAARFVLKEMVTVDPYDDEDFFDKFGGMDEEVGC